VTASIGPEAIAAFNERHMEEFRSRTRGRGAEITGVRLVTYVDTPSPRVARGFGAPTVMARAAGTRRREPGWRLPGTQVYLGSELSPGLK